MSYRVLARAYRSQTFDEVVGQEAIATTLKNAIDSNRVHHGYLFTGTRGVGKTSMARILAKALNCLAFDDPTTKPCCECESCVAVSEGEDVDVVEIDAASHTGVDHIRELRSNAAFRPARARFKIYIIDEVHMLSTGAFNALLKTLEEPPGHVKFILATTDPEKVPQTIQSRCQQFDFHAIDISAIELHLREILGKENVEAEDAVVRRIARLGNGSMRDALSLLDKVLSYEPKHLTAKSLEDVIPPAHDELAAGVVAAMADGDPATALAAFDAALAGGRTLDRFCESLIAHTRTLMLICVCGKDTELADVPAEMRSELSQQAAKFDAPTYVYMISLLEELRRNIRFSGSGRALADAAIVRLTLAEQFTDITALIENMSGDLQTDSSRSPSKKKDNQSGLVEPAMSKSATRKSEPLSSSTSSSTTSSTIVPTAVEAVVSAEPSASAPTTSTLHPTVKSVSSTLRGKVSADPLVMRIKDAVDGTLVDIRSPSGPEIGACEPSVGLVDEL